MGSGKKALIGAGLVAVATLLLFAAGNDSDRATASGVEIQNPARPELRLATGVTRAPVLARSTLGGEK